MLSPAKLAEVRARLEALGREPHQATEQEAHDHNALVRSMGRPEEQIAAGDTVYPVSLVRTRSRLMVASAFVDVPADEGFVFPDPVTPVAVYGFADPGHLGDVQE